MNFNDKEKIIQLTSLWKGERLPDGRPKVEDKYLDALYGMTLEADFRIGLRAPVCRRRGKPA